MKKWHISQHKLLVTAIGTLAIGTMLILTIIPMSASTNSSQPDRALCPEMKEETQSQLKGQSNSLQFHPIKIVAEPWRGEHNVYAIFTLPLKYKDIYYRSELLVKGSDTHWYVTITDGRKYGLTTIPEDSFLLIGFFRTRLALWYWLNGKFSDLQQPCNWTLHLFP